MPRNRLDNPVRKRVEVRALNGLFDTLPNVLRVLDSRFTQIMFFNLTCAARGLIYRSIHERFPKRGITGYAAIYGACEVIEQCIVHCATRNRLPKVFDRTKSVFAEKRHSAEDLANT